MVGVDDVRFAAGRIRPFVTRTPLVTSSLLNQWLGHEVWFKAENLQKTGAFKVRGAFNAALKAIESHGDDVSFVAFSSGNHAQALAYVGQQLGKRVTLCLPKHAAEIKRRACLQYGAEVLVFDDRQQAEVAALEREKAGSILIRPFDDEGVVAGQGTSCFEVLEDGFEPQAVFVPCGGGGLLSGSMLALEAFGVSAPVFACEPRLADDAARSLACGKLVRLDSDPVHTLADGARSLSLAELTFDFLKRSGGVLLIDEDEIVYWCQWVMNLLKMVVEPTAALAVAGAYQWLQEQPQGQKVLVVLSGGNIDVGVLRRVWEEDVLSRVPGFSG